MDQIQNVVVSEMKDSIYIRPARLNYLQNNIAKTWDIIRVHEGVVIIIFNVTRKVFVCVKQFRPAVYYNGLPSAVRLDTVDTIAYPGSLGVTLEMCAGIVDKENMSLEEIAKEEVLEECGYDVPVSLFEKVKTFRAGVGISGEPATLFYVEVTDSMRKTDGGGNTAEGEFIHVVELTIPEIKAYVDQPEVLSPGGFIMAVYWFLANKAQNF